MKIACVNLLSLAYVQAVQDKQVVLPFCRTAFALHALLLLSLKGSHQFSLDDSRASDERQEHLHQEMKLIL